MAYFTGKDVDVWITTEHDNDYIEVVEGLLKMKVGAGTTGSAITTQGILSGSLDMAGVAGNRITDVSGCDLSVGAQDEDISFFGLRNVGKIEVKKDTSVTITRKKSNNKNLIAFQGQTLGASSYSNPASGNGLHSARWGLIENTGATAMVIADGTVDPKSTLDDASKQSYGYRVFIELKASTAAHDGAADGVVLVIPNCTMMEYSGSISNESANEETFTFASMVKPIIWNGDDDSNGAYDTGAITQTAAADM